MRAAPLLRMGAGSSSPPCGVWALHPPFASARHVGRAAGGGEGKGVGCRGVLQGDVCEGGSRQHMGLCCAGQHTLWCKPAQ